jgi:hypothetical protein
LHPIAHLVSALLIPLKLSFHPWHPNYKLLIIGSHQLVKKINFGTLKSQGVHVINYSQIRQH